MIAPIEGFSKLSKTEKIRWIARHYSTDPEQCEALLKQYWNPDEKIQQLHEEFIENTISNFYLPMGVAPNFRINDRMYAIPMVTEESSVVAAASKAAKFWLERGGFRARVLGTVKVGQIHLRYTGNPEALSGFVKEITPVLLTDTEPITRNMVKRGGGIRSIELRDRHGSLAGYYQLHCSFETQDAMGANFINSCLERMAETLLREAGSHPAFEGKEDPIEVLMCILSNYVPDCRVRAEVRCPVDELADGSGLPGTTFAKRMVRAIQIADAEPYRAVTHNKGIMNGIDAVVMATGNDFRAVEAGVHAYAAHTGTYRSLSQAAVEDGEFHFWLEVPLALGTVGGLTSLHPLVKLALELLGKPSARELMEITATAGLAQNFAALRSLVTDGIQRGHMKMHLLNMANQLGASQSEKDALVAYFRTHTVSHDAVAKRLGELRGH